MLFLLVIVILVTLLAFGPPSPADLRTSVEEVKDSLAHPHLPLLNPFGPSAHKPPVQPNSTSGVVEWFSDFKWRNPFSSSITFDENRAVLPPLKERPPIYTYYEDRSKEEGELTDAENRLILAWRRAWWAQGFKPQVLGRAEAMKNPLYEMVQRLELDSKIELELMRWLAWGHMGSGILANWLALPMAPTDNKMLSFLRRNQYPILSRVEGLENGIFFGEGPAINDAIQKMLDNRLFRAPQQDPDNQQNIAELAQLPGGIMVNMLTEDDIAVDAKADGIAYYTARTLSSKYSVVAQKLDGKTQADGMNLLMALINSHLHLIFQNSFPEGIAVLRPLAEHTTALTFQAIDIARKLTQCPTSPMPMSCPPNRPKCAPCNSQHMQDLRLVPSFENISTLYTIGSVPHPLTLTLLHYTRDIVDERFLRRSAHRDLWIFAATEKLLGDKVSGQNRLVHFKDAVASPHSRSNSLWLTAERESQKDVDWIFGFKLPDASVDSSASLVSTGPQPRPPMPVPQKGISLQDEQFVKNEEMRLKLARKVIKHRDADNQRRIDMAEMWNLADAEAWKFARAFSARRRMERKKWEKEEQDFAGAERKAGVGGDGRGVGSGNRWSD